MFRATLQGPAGFSKAVALKVIKGGVHDQMGDMEQALFLREARLGGLLRHPNLVDVYELGEVENEWFISMEWVDGLTLSDAISQGGALPLPVFLSVARGLCAGLQNAHMLTVKGQRVGLVHRDIKPSNVLLGWNGAIKIADFGLAHVGVRLANENGFLSSGGSPGYMSPEQWASKLVDARSDLFSLGCVLYELALGESLFDLRSGAKLRTAVQEVESRFANLGALATLDDRCAGLGDVVHRCLRVDPDNRLSSAAEVDAILENLEALIPRHPSVRDWLRGLRTEEDKLLLASVETLDLDFFGEDTPPSTGSEPDDAPVVQTNLVEEPNAFVGRTTELSTLSTLLKSGQRLVTVMGPPGTGKTRLVKRFGALWLDSEQVNHVWFCDLTEARTSAGVLSSVAAALNVPLTDKTSDETVWAQRIGNAIAARGPMLLLVDNVEQVAEIAGQWLSQWWEQATETRFVVTSRVPLRIAIEQQFSVCPLPLPRTNVADSDNEAVALFVSRAQAVQPSFDLAGDNRTDVAAIVTELDGLPLAIELAAARVRMWAPKQLRARLSDRFRLLSRPSASVSRRQATLLGALDWSWELLQPWEQAALAQCSVFRGGFDWEATEGVLDLHDWPEAPWIVDVVAALVEHSLIIVEEGFDGERRLRLLVSVTAYGAGKLKEMGQTEATQQRHARHYATYGTKENLDALNRHGGLARRRRLGAELENLVVATERSIASGWTQTAVGTSVTVLVMCSITGPFEPALSRAERVLALGALGTERSRLIYQIGMWHHAFGNMKDAIVHYTEALALYQKEGDRRGEGIVLGNLGAVHMNQGRMESAAEHYTQALSIVREMGHRRFEGIVLGYLGILHMNQGRIEAAAEHYTQSLAMAREVGYRRGEGILLANLGALHKKQGRMQEADAHYTQSLAIHRKVGDRRFEGIVLINLGTLYWQQNQIEEAVDCYTQALEIHRKVGEHRFEGIVLSNLGLLHKKQDRMKDAADCYTQALAIHRKAGDRRGEGTVLSSLGLILAHNGDLETAHQCLTEAEFIADELGLNSDSELVEEITNLRSALTARTLTK